MVLKQSGQKQKGTALSTSFKKEICVAIRRLVLLLDKIMNMLGRDWAGESLKHDHRPTHQELAQKILLETEDTILNLLFRLFFLDMNFLTIFLFYICCTSRYKLSGGSGTKGLDTAVYLIENSKCNCVAVQKRGQNAGYVLNTKNPQEFLAPIMIIFIQSHKIT